MNFHSESFSTILKGLAVLNREAAAARANFICVYGSVQRPAASVSSNDRLREPLAADHSTDPAVIPYTDKSFALSPADLKPVCSHLYFRQRRRRFSHYRDHTAGRSKAFVEGSGKGR